MVCPIILLTAIRVGGGLEASRRLSDIIAQIPKPGSLLTAPLNRVRERRTSDALRKRLTTLPRAATQVSGIGAAIFKLLAKRELCKPHWPKARRDA